MERINLHIRLRSMLDLMWDHISVAQPELCSSRLFESLKCRVNGLQYGSETEFWTDMESECVYKDKGDDGEELQRRFTEIKDMIHAAVMHGNPLPVDFGRPPRCDSPTSSGSGSKGVKKGRKKRAKLNMGGPRGKGAKAAKVKPSPPPTLKDLSLIHI